MIDERHFDELLHEVGDELDRLAARHDVDGGRDRDVQLVKSRRLPLLATASVVAIGVSALAVLVPGRGGSPERSTDPFGVSDASTPISPAPSGLVTAALSGPASAEQIYTVQSGDFLNGIASDHGITPEQIAIYNDWSDGMEHPLFVGEEIRIPPGAAVTPAPIAPESSAFVATTAPREMSAAEYQVDVPYLMLASPPPGYSATRSITGFYGKDFEPPALLLGWPAPSLDGDAYVPVVLSQQPWNGAPLPESRDVRSGDVMGWIATVDGATVGVFDVGGMPVHVWAASTAIADDDLVALVSDTPPSMEVEFVGGRPPEPFVELQRQAVDAFGNFTVYSNADGGSDADGGELTFGTLTAVPLNGLTIGADSTVMRVIIQGGPGTVISGSTAGGATEYLLFWEGLDGTVGLLGVAGHGTELTVDDLVALAEHARPANDDEIEQFEEM